LPSDFEAVIRCLSRHIFPVEKLVSNVVKPTEAADAMKAWSANPANTFRILVAF
jgi:threonine dehydrogenase-like Zn-dependent dehydrogenase